jgi:hypothetical protein
LGPDESPERRLISWRVVRLSLSSSFVDVGDVGVGVVKVGVLAVGDCDCEMEEGERDEMSVSVSRNLRNG